MRVLSFPLRLAPGGSMVTVEQGSDDYYAEQIAVLLLTAPGERPMAPDLGAGDLTFSRIAPSAIRHQAATYVPDVIVDKVTVTPTSDTATNVEVAFHPKEAS